ncbi:SGNH/GDSL hydrolase family protein [Planococcus halocryophilus]|uniref:SGNH/GDSL hydrolase family protein n=1 Tax=Planococcus halocryophilus TaxID=1215089 RepID=UPI002E81760D|nr:SGNH/GDSL hydrolase family protein [Planococcus halocryophilus]
MDTDVIKHAPDLVVISTGLNDALGAWKIPVKEYAANYQAIVEAIVASGDTEVVIRTPNPTTSVEYNVKMKSYIQASRELTSQDKVYLFDFYQIMADDVHAKNISQLDLMQNKLHPNIKGQAYLSEQFKTYFTSEIIQP